MSSLSPLALAIVQFACYAAGRIFFAKVMDLTVFRDDPILPEMLAKLRGRNGNGNGGEIPGNGSHSILREY